MQNHPLLSYFSKLSIFSICVCFAFLFCSVSPAREFLSENMPYYVVMFYILTALSYVSLYLLPKKMKVNFIHIFLITKMLKFIIYLSVLVIVLLFGIETNVKFAVSYLVMFLMFLTFDTVTTNKLSRKEAEKKKKKRQEEKQSKNNEDEKAAV